MKLSLTITDPTELFNSKKEGLENMTYTVDMEDKEKTSQSGSQDILDPENIVKPKWYLRFLGIFSAILASIVFSLGTIIVKAIQSFHALNLSQFRFQGVMIPSLCVLLFYCVTGKKDAFKTVLPGKANPNFKNNIIFLFLRGLLACGAVVFQIYSLQHLDVGDSTVIVMSSPIFVALLAHFVLKEDLGYIPVLVSVTCLSGVVIIARPPFITGENYDFDALIGVGMAVASLAFSSVLFVILRYLKDVPTCLVTSSFGVMGSVVTLVLALAFGVFELPDTLYEWTMAIGLGLLTFLGQMFFTLALSYEQAGPVAVIRTGDVVFSLLWQYIFLGVRPDMYSLIGTFIIFGGVLVIGVRKSISMLPEGHPSRKTFRFLLL